MEEDAKAEIMLGCSVVSKGTKMDSVRAAYTRRRRGCIVVVYFCLSVSNDDFAWGIRSIKARLERRKTCTGETPSYYTNNKQRRLRYIR
jgi:hypothetical protein